MIRTLIESIIVTCSLSGLIVK